MALCFRVSEILKVQVQEVLFISTTNLVYLEGNNNGFKSKYILELPLSIRQ